MKREHQLLLLIAVSKFGDFEKARIKLTLFYFNMSFDRCLIHWQYCFEVNTNSLSGQK